MSKTNDGGLKIIDGVPIFSSESDFTVFLDAKHKQFRRLMENTGESSIRLKNGDSFLEGRGIICSCFERQALSITVRVNSNQPDNAKKNTNDFAEYDKTIKRNANTGFKASTSVDYGLTSIDSIVKSISRVIFSKLPATGLVLITGSTNSAKSIVCRGLIHEYLTSTSYLNDPKYLKRRPHLVTIEDPLEALFLDLGHWSDPTCRVRIDYTPRVLGSTGANRDAKSLKFALHDCLRQSPSCVYIGEVRNNRDWRDILEFAATGHLVITTAHANSLAEAFSKIFANADISTPAARGQIASRILAVVNQKFIKPVGSDKGLVLPTIWHRSSKSIAHFISEGLSSLVPENSFEENSDVTCLGRSWFANEFVKMPEFDSSVEGVRRKSIVREILRFAAGHDINGT